MKKYSVRASVTYEVKAKNEVLAATEVKHVIWRMTPPNLSVGGLAIVGVRTLWPGGRNKAPRCLARME